jgi:hypothetical protein
MELSSVAAGGFAEASISPARAHRVRALAIIMGTREFFIFI